MQLIKRQMNFNVAEAKSWASRFLQEAGSMHIPKSYTLNRSRFSKEEEWVCVIPPKQHSLPLLKSISKQLDKYYKLSACHAYKDQKGNLQFYTLRLQDKSNPAKKIVLPLSYGYRRGQSQEHGWSLKAYRTIEGKNPIYHLEVIAKDAHKPILIVEGEKTADAAQKMLGESYLCISWLGGSGAASKVDWKPLFNRKVFIWSAIYILINDVYLDLSLF